ARLAAARAGGDRGGVSPGARGAWPRPAVGGLARDAPAVVVGGGLAAAAGAADLGQPGGPLQLGVGARPAQSRHPAAVHTAGRLVAQSGGSDPAPPGAARAGWPASAEGGRSESLAGSSDPRLERRPDPV